MPEPDEGMQKREKRYFGSYTTGPDFNLLPLWLFLFNPINWHHTSACLTSRLDIGLRTTTSCYGCTQNTDAGLELWSWPLLQRHHTQTYRVSSSSSSSSSAARCLSFRSSVYDTVTAWWLLHFSKRKVYLNSAVFFFYLRLIFRAWEENLLNCRCKKKPVRLWFIPIYGSSQIEAELICCMRAPKTCQCCIVVCGTTT